MGVNVGLSLEKDEPGQRGKQREPRCSDQGPRFGDGEDHLWLEPLQNQVKQGDARSDQNQVQEAHAQDSYGAVLGIYVHTTDQGLARSDSA